MTLEGKGIRIEVNCSPGKIFKVFGGQIPMIVVSAPGAEEALCYARRLCPDYCSVQTLTQSNMNYYPCVTSKTKFFDCVVLCSYCKNLNLYFRKSTCTFDRNLI